MTTGSAALVRLDAKPIMAAAVLTAGVVGVALAVNLPYGIVLLLAACYAPLVVLNLQVGLALWVPLVFLEGVPVFNLGGKAAALLIIAAWIPTLLRAHDTAAILRRHRTTFSALVLLLLWLTLSALWAEDSGHVFSDAWHWWAVGLLYVVVATTVATERGARMVIMGFVAGALASVILGLLDGHLTATTTATAAATAEDARLAGGAGNPNRLAAGMVAAIVLAGGLAATSRSPVWRLGVVGAVLVLTVGLAASQSRGGMIAALVTVVAALVFFKRRRAYVVGLGLIATGVAVAWFATSPSAWERVSSFDNGGSGRSEIWTVAWRVFEDHRLAGAGLNNFGVVAGDYVLHPGALQRVDLIAENPHVVHNTYLQLLAENGVIACALFLVIAVGSLRAAWKAGMRFEARGAREHEDLARAVLVAGIALLTTAFFSSGGVDRRLWILFALGPALLRVASRTADSAPRPRLYSGIP
jgi:O-antigen ligase